jgi:hypothetical protein
MTKIRIVFNRLLGGWFIVTGPHQTPIGGRFDSKADAQTWLWNRGAKELNHRFNPVVWAQNNRGE